MQLPSGKIGVLVFAAIVIAIWLGLIIWAEVATRRSEARL